jgi:enoyl-CoA hydratase/isomerase-like protein
MSTVPEPALSPVLTTVEAHVAYIVLNRPRARNAITVALATGLAEALREAAARARVIVIRGAGGHFCGAGRQPPELRPDPGRRRLAAAAAPGRDAARPGPDPVRRPAHRGASRAVGTGLPLRDGLALETDAIIEHLGGADAAAGISRFTGRDQEEST